MSSFLFAAKRTIFYLSLLSSLASMGLAKEDFDPSSLDVSNYIKEFMHLSSQLTGATRSNAYIVLSKPMCHFIQECFHFLKDTSETISPNLETCCNTLAQGALQLKVKDIFSIIPDLSKCLLLWSSRALRPGANDVVGANGCDNGALLQALQSIQCSLDNFDCSTSCTLALNCAHTPICEPGTISQPGAYCLCQDIEGIITIDSDDVDLDLNNYRIFGDINGIIITSGRHRVRVHNGSINNTVEQAIIVGDATSFITLDTIEITDVATGDNIFALDFQTSVTGRITNCLIQNVRIGRTQAGILLRNADNSIIDNCFVSECFSSTSTATGIIIASSLFFSSIFNPDELAALPGSIEEVLAIPGFCSSNEIKNCSVSTCSAEVFSAGGIITVGAVDTLISNNHVSGISGGWYTLGIEAAVSPGSKLEACTVTELSSTSTFLQTIGLWVISSSATIIQNCSAAAIGFDSLNSPGCAGVFVGSSSNSILENILVVDIGVSVTAVGCWIDSDSDNTILRNCLCTNVQGDEVGIGFNLLSNNLICQDCSIEAARTQGQLFPTNFAYGYDIGGLNNPPSINNVSCIRCHAANVTANTEARGFRVNSNTAYLFQCDVEHVIVPPASTGTISRGYDVLITSTEVLFDSCTAKDIRNPLAGEGFNVEGSATQLQDCTVTHAQVGILVPLTLGSATNPTINRCSVSYCADTGIIVAPISNGITTNCYATNNNTNYDASIPFQVGTGVPYNDPSVVTGFNLSA